MAIIETLGRVTCWLLAGGVGVIFVLSLLDCLLTIPDKFIIFREGDPSPLPQTDNVWLALVSPYHALSDRKWERLQEISWVMPHLYFLVSAALFYPSVIIGAVVNTVGTIAELLEGAARAIRKIFS